MEEARTATSFSEDCQHLISLVNHTHDAAQKMLDTWRTTELKTANEEDNDVDAYVKPMLTLTELIRTLRVPDILVSLYRAVISAIRQHEDAEKVQLHKGAVYANLAIAYLERGLYSQAVALLYAAAKEDVQNCGRKDPYGSYGLSSDGILGQWLDLVLGNLPAASIQFVNDHLSQQYEQKDVKEFCLWLIANGDMRFVSSIVEFVAVREHTDLHSDSVRLQCVRDLAGLFEVLWKRLGARHSDRSVVAAFADHPSLAGLICHMHFARRRNSRRQDPTFNAHKSAGLLWNSIVQSQDVLEAIDGEIDDCNRQSVEEAWGRISSVSTSTNPKADAIAKRFLLAYRLRNQTAHTFDPQDADFVGHYDDFFEWLLAANLYLYFWQRESGQVSL